MEAAQSSLGLPPGQETASGRCPLDTRHGMCRPLDLGRPAPRLGEMKACCVSPGVCSSVPGLEPRLAQTLGIYSLHPLFCEQTSFFRTAVQCPTRLTPDGRSKHSLGGGGDVSGTSSWVTCWTQAPAPAELREPGWGAYTWCY